MSRQENDHISRQAAIDAFMNLSDCENGYSGTYDKAQIIGVLEDLPSAETNIVTVTIDIDEKRLNEIVEEAERRLAAEAEDAAVLQEAISGLTKSMNKVADPESKLFIDESEEE